MDPELRKKLYFEKHRTSIVSTAALVLLLPIMVIFSQATTIFQQKAAGLPEDKTEISGAITLSPDKNLNYTLLMKCFDKPGQTNPCTPEEHKAVDLNNDGIVDGVDYNLYVRETSNLKNH